MWYWGRGNRSFGRLAGSRRIRVGSWNVRSLTCKFFELGDVLRRHKVDIACFQETKWKGSRAREGNGYKLWHSGSSIARNGVGIILAGRHKDNVVRVTRRSDRIMAISIVIEGETVNVISAYAPQVGLSEADKKRFWDALGEMSGDHNTQIDYLLVRKGDLKACKDCRAFPGRPRILWKNLNGEAVETFRATIFERLTVEDMSASNTDQMWNTLACVMKYAAKDSLATKQSRFKDLLSCNEGNQENIDRAKERYKAAKREAKIAVAKAKDKAYEDLYKKLDSKEGVNEIYKIAKARERRRRDIGNVKYIKDEGGRTIVREEDIRTRWGEYFSSLFNETPFEESRPKGSGEVGRSSSPTHFDCYYSRINHEEVRAALQNMGRNKVVGPDQIPIEAWRCLGDEGVKWLTCLFNKIFSSAKMPDEWRLSEVILQEQGRRASMESRVSENQFGFIPERSTTEAINLLRSLMEKYRERQRDLHMAFLDLEKAYDSVPQYFPVNLGLYHGSAISPYLFTLILDELSNGIQENIPWCMIFADDIVLIAELAKRLNNRLESWRKTLEDNGLR
nr:hypothetical protein [Tanacetum cinerariifolium]